MGRGSWTWATESRITLSSATGVLPTMRVPTTPNTIPQANATPTQ